MHRPIAPTAALLAAALLLLSTTATDGRLADPPDELKAGREALSRGDGPAAVTLLESALLAVSASERAAVLDDLRRAYERAAAQAEAAGDTRRARLYRDNLQIITRSRRSTDRAVSPASNETNATGSAARSTDAAPPATGPAARSTDAAPPPAPADPLPTPDTSALVPVDEDSSNTAETEDSETAPEFAPIPAPSPANPSTPGQQIDANLDLPRGGSPAPAAPESNPVPAEPSRASSVPPADSQTVSDVLRSADAAFRAQKYDDAGRVYAMLAQRDQLPESHKPVWAYCRFVAVARRINAQPSTPAEWSAIHAEIREVRALAPEIWFSEYLRRLATERSAAVGARPSAFIVRGQSEANTSGSGVASRSWQVVETESFRIFHLDDPSLANRLARRVEQARSDLFRYWTGTEPKSSWSPRCDVYVYPNATTYSRMTGQPADSPGFSTMSLNGGRVVTRRINLRADAERLAEAVAPHEVSHVVLADLFPSQQVPRWADEGMAVLAEPRDAQAARLADLQSPLDSGRVFRSGAIMTASSPNADNWDLYMAQSTSLTQYLVQLDTPARFLNFLRQAERLGPEQALKTIYGFKDFDDLHARWLSHARRGATTPPEGLIAVRPEGGAPRVR